jgi:hypothetical protein
VRSECRRAYQVSRTIEFNRSRGGFRLVRHLFYLSTSLYRAAAGPREGPHYVTEYTLNPGS